MLDLKSKGYLIVYCDESCITKSTISTHDWSVKYENTLIDLKSMQWSCIATLGAISYENGIELVVNYPKLVNIDKFKEFLIKLKQLHPNEKIGLFMDKLSVHRSKKVRE